MTTMVLHTIYHFHVTPLPLLSLLPSSSSSPVIRPNNKRSRILRISYVADDDGSTAAFVSIQQAVEEEEEEEDSASATEVVREFYAGINGRDLSSVQGLISDNCVYEDLIFSTPFIGRKEILDFFQKFIDSISTDLQFVIDDISGEDTSAIGVTWHLEWKGKPFPFSKGCSFYRLDVLNGKRQIVYGRDCVEPATKPGEMALVIIRGVTWLLQQFPQLADQL